MGNTVLKIRNSLRKTLDKIITTVNIHEVQLDDKWDDMKFPATKLRQGATSKPDFDITEVGLLFPQNDASEIAYMIAQMPHKWKLKSVLRPHIHLVQDSVNVPVFKLQYRWYKNGEDPTGAFTTITTNAVAFDYISGSIMQIIIFPEIDGSNIDTVSSIIDMKLFRDDNIVTGDVLVKEFDIHCLIDSYGSEHEYIK